MKNKIIAITGGIGSGKSEVLKYLRYLGYETLDCDVLAKEVACRIQVVEQVRKLLGDEYVTDGQLNRKAIRDKVFADKDLLKKYNAIFFAEVKKLLDERIAMLGGKSVVFVEISVFDAFDYAWDEVWLIEADAETRINRAITRDKSTRQVMENIILAQNVCKVFTRRITNNGSVDELKKQVDNALVLISQKN